MMRALAKKIIGMTLFGLVIANTVITDEAFARTSHDREYYLKGAFLRYVAKFVNWPEESLPSYSLNICILGNIPSLEGLNSINGKVVKDRSLVIKPIPQVEAVNEAQCQILFVGRSEQEKLTHIVDRFKTSPILTFGDMEGFAEIGGAMNFYIVNNRMGIMINQQTVNESQLTIDPKMLRLVTVVPDVTAFNFPLDVPMDKVLN